MTDPQYDAEYADAFDDELAAEALVRAAEQAAEVQVLRDLHSVLCLSSHMAEAEPGPFRWLRTQWVRFGVSIAAQVVGQMGKALEDDEIASLSALAGLILGEQAPKT